MRGAGAGTPARPRGSPRHGPGRRSSSHDLAEIRLVEIVGFDTQADGGCHVRSLREIGRLALTKTENKGKANRRVYFVLEEAATR